MTHMDMPGVDSMTQPPQCFPVLPKESMFFLLTNRQVNKM